MTAILFGALAVETTEALCHFGSLLAAGIRHLKSRWAQRSHVSRQRSGMGVETDTSHIACYTWPGVHLTEKLDKMGNGNGQS